MIKSFLILLYIFSVIRDMFGFTGMNVFIGNKFKHHEIIVFDNYSIEKSAHSHITLFWNESTCSGWDRVFGTFVIHWELCLYCKLGWILAIQTEFPSNLVSNYVLQIHSQGDLVETKFNPSLRYTGTESAYTHNNWQSIKEKVNDVEVTIVFDSFNKREF